MCSDAGASGSAAQFFDEETGQTHWPLKRRILGLSGTHWARIVLEHFGIESKLTPQQLVDEWEHHLETLYATIDPLPGAQRVVDHVANHVPVAIATSSNAHAVAKKRAAHPELFSPARVVVCGDDPELARGKPAPDIFLLAAQRLGVEPARCLVVEDSPFVRPRQERGSCSPAASSPRSAGVQAGLAAGMRVLAVPDPNVEAHKDPRFNAPVRGAASPCFFSALIAAGRAQLIDGLEAFDPTSIGLPAFPGEV